MELFSDIEKPKVNLFKDKTALTSKHLLEEDEVIDRNSETEATADYIRKTLAGSGFKILFIYGPSGLGKTAISRYVLSKLQSEDVEQALPMYVDCMDKTTRHSVLSELMRFYRAFYDGKGRGCDEIIQEFSDKLRRSQKIPIIALDNFDRISDLQQLLWDLNDLSTSIQCGVILISTGKFDLFSKLGKRIRSSFGVKELYFKQYGEELLFEILTARARNAFSAKVSDKALSQIASHAAEKDGNAKIAFNLLMDAGEIAQWSNAKKLEEGHVREAILKFERGIAADKIREIERNKLKCFRVLKCIAELERKRKEIYTGDLIKYIREKKIKITERTLANYLKYLENKGLIETKLVGRGKGRSKEIKLKTPKDLLEI